VTGLGWVPRSRAEGKDFGMCDLLSKVPWKKGSKESRRGLEAEKRSGLNKVTETVKHESYCQVVLLEARGQVLRLHVTQSLTLSCLQRRG
jgi:hypothetical protein